jgi:biotin synthase
MIRNNWTKEEIQDIYVLIVRERVYQAATVHRLTTIPEVEVCTLLSVKTGGCSEDCVYCPQAARYHTDVRCGR